MTKARILAVSAAVGAAIAAMAPTSTVTSAPGPKNIALTPVGVYRSGHFDRGGAEIAAYDAATNRVFVVNLEDQRIDVLDISVPSAPWLATTISVTPWGSQANSLAVHDGLVAVAVESFVKTDPGRTVFFTTDGLYLNDVVVGALPDMLTFTPNGQLLLVANEGEPNSYNQTDSVDPEGSVSIVDMRGGVASLTQADVTTAGFAAFNGATLDPSIRIFGPNATVAQDLEPEYIAVSHDSRLAWVTLQENNALAILDLRERRVTSLVGLGFKDHTQAGRGLDSSDRDGHLNIIMSWPVLGMYQPDGIAAFEHGGRTYLITANEGDVREWPGLPGGTEAARVSSLGLDATAFTGYNTATLKTNAVLGRLNVTKYNGNTDADADYEQLYAFGTRSVSIWDAAGAQVFDSGDALEQLTAALFPQFFNANHTNNLNTQPNANDWTHDSRSDDKGPEPEGVTVARLFGRQFAFVVLERIGGVVIYEITAPAAPRFVDYVNVRGFGVPAEVPAGSGFAAAAAEDLGPEGVLVVSEADSPTGTPLLVVANEVSGTTRIFEISMVK